MSDEVQDREDGLTVEPDYSPIETAGDNGKSEVIGQSEDGKSEAGGQSEEVSTAEGGGAASPASTTQPGEVSDASLPGSTRAIDYGILKPGEKPPEGHEYDGEAPGMDGFEHRNLSWTELYTKMNPYEPESDEDREKREKREKREGIIARTGDFVSALANLWFAHKGAPNMFDGANTLTAAAKKRWEKLRAEREANKKAWFEGYMKARAMDEDKYQTDRKFDYVKSRDKVEDQYRKSRDVREEKKEERARKKAEQDEQMFQLRYLLQLGKLTEQGYRNAVWEVKAGTIKELTQAQIDRYNRMGTGGSRGSGGNSGGGITWYDSDGNVHYAKTGVEQRQKSIDAGTWVEPDQTTTTTTEKKIGDRTQTTTRTVTKKGKGYSKKPEGKGKGNRTNMDRVKW